MRLSIILSFLLCANILVAQSKKALQAEVNSLKAEIVELKKPKEINLTDEHKKASYGLGVLVASNLKMQAGDSIDVEIITEAIKDVFQNDSLKISQQESSTLVQNYMQKAMEKKAGQAREEGNKFLEANKLKEGVKVTASGLQYQVIKSGSGKMPTANDQVTVHYTGKLLDGTVFDSSVEREQPATFGVGQVIKGWTEALQLMREGDKWTLYIPENLAYGDRGAGGQIPPYATLVFDVELIKVN